MKTLFYHIWNGNHQLIDIINDIETKNPDRIVFSAMEEYEYNPPFDPIMSEKLNHLIIQNNIQFIFLFGSSKSEFYNTHHLLGSIKCEIYHFPLFWLYLAFERLVYSGGFERNLDSNIDKLFISLNNKTPDFRCKLMDALCKNNLIEHGYLSWIDTHNNHNWECWQQKKLVLDEKYAETLDQYITFPSVYKKALVNVIPETTPRVSFLTEKTFTAILFKQPFLILGSRHIHKVLIDNGFKLYDEIFDYSFDNMDNIDDRINGIIQNLNKIRERNYTEIRKLIQYKIEFNYNHAIDIVVNKKNVPEEIKLLIKELIVTNHEEQIKIIDSMINDKNSPSYNYNVAIDIFLNKNKDKNTKVKIFINENEKQCVLLHNVRYHEVAFHIEKDKYKFVTNVEDADIIPVLISGNIVEKANFIGSNIKNQHLLVLRNTHIANGENNGNYSADVEIWKDYTDKVIILHTNYGSQQYLYYDFWWNLFKAYFVDYDKYDLSNRLWTYGSTKKMFYLDDIKLINPKKKFLIPNKVHDDEGTEHRIEIRKKIRNFILEEDCFFSDPTNYIFLWPEERTDDIIDNFLRGGGHYAMGNVGWHPIANKYYQESIVSVYCETISSNVQNTRCITEKTFTPLIKGHFILPYAYPGIVNDLKTRYGFRFPEWIDYKYDQIIDDNARFYEFVISFNKLRCKSIEELTNLYYKDIDILKHNRNIFFTREYDSLYEKLSKIIFDSKRFI